MEVRTTSSTGGQKGVKEEAFALIPVGPLQALARHYGRGAKKYAEHQWRQGFEWSKAYSAAQRHLNQFWSGEDLDECPRDREGCAPFPDDESPLTIEARDYTPTCYNHTGSPHLVAAAWMIFALIEFTECYPQHDDRYIIGEDGVGRMSYAHAVDRSEKQSSPPSEDMTERYQAQVRSLRTVLKAT